MQVPRELQTRTARSELSHACEIAFWDRCHYHHISCPVLLLHVLIPSTPFSATAPSSQCQGDGRRTVLGTHLYPGQPGWRYFRAVLNSQNSSIY